MLNEDGVTGQVTVDDWGITGVEVARDSEKSTGQETTKAEARNPSLHPFPVSSNTRREQEGKGHTPGFYISREVHYMTVHQSLGQGRIMKIKQLSLTNNLQNTGEKRKLSPISSQETQGTRASKRHSVLYKHDWSRFPAGTNKALQCWGPRYI